MPSPTHVGDRVTDFLRERYHQCAAENVAADLKAWGVKPKTIAKMIERRSTPNGYLFLALLCVYGPEYLLAMWPEAPDWVHAAFREAEQRRLEAAIAADQRRLAKLRDGR